MTSVIDAVHGLLEANEAAPSLSRLSRTPLRSFALSFPAGDL